MKNCPAIFCKRVSMVLMTTRTHSWLVINRHDKINIPQYCMIISVYFNQYSVKLHHNKKNKNNNNCFNRTDQAEGKQIQNCHITSASSVHCINVLYMHGQVDHPLTKGCVTNPNHINRLS